jgi:hypothetical protein
MAEHDWNPQTLNFAQEFAGAKGIKVGFKMPAIQTPEDLEAALLLPAQFENVAEKSDSQQRPLLYSFGTNIDGGWPYFTGTTRARGQLHAFVMRLELRNRHFHDFIGP